MGNKLTESMIKHLQGSVHECPIKNDLKFKSLEQTTEVVSDLHLKALFESGDNPTGVDFELLINSKVHREEFDNLDKGITEHLEKIDAEVVKVNETIERIDTTTKAHMDNDEIHLTSNEKIDVSKIPNLELAIESLNSTVNGIGRQHIVNTIEEMNALTDILHADICHVIQTSETYIYDLHNVSWIKVSDFDALVSVDWSVILNKPTEFNPTKHNHTIDDVENLSEMLEGALGGTLEDYVKKSGDTISGHIKSEDGIHFYAGTGEGENGNLWSGFHSRRKEIGTGTILESAFGLGSQSYVIYAQMGLHDYTDDNKMLNRLLLGRDVLRSQYPNHSDLGDSYYKWRTLYTNNVDTNTLKVNGKNIYVQSTAPTTPTTGDIWIQV